MRFVIFCAVLSVLTGCSVRDWQATVGNLFESVCNDSSNCTRICPDGERPVGPVGTC